MKVLFLESNHKFIFGLPLGFRDAGHKIVVSGKINKEKLNKLFLSFNPDLVVMLGWSIEHTDENLFMVHQLIKTYQKPLIYWATEDPTFTIEFSIPLIQKVLPNYIFTVSSSALELYKSRGFNASFLPFGYQPSLYPPLQCHPDYEHEISLIANAYPNVLYYDKNHYRQTSMNILLKPLLAANIRVDIWGGKWDKMDPFLGHTIPTNWLHGTIHYLNTNSIYKCSDMILGLQNYNQDVIAMRTYEILGAGGFLITSTHKELEKLFVSGKELVIVPSEKEMLEIYSYYKYNPKERERIKKNGQLAVKNHTYQKRAEEIIRILKAQALIP